MKERGDTSSAIGLPRRLLGWGALLAAATLALFVLYAHAEPERFGVADRVWTLDLAAVQPEQGSAYLYPIDLDIPSNADGSTSPLILREDGMDLVVDNNHQHIRDEGGGRYSHWRGFVYLSATDGSDPRENGRRYEFALPGMGEPLIVERLPSFLGVAVGLLALGLILRPGRGALLGAVVALALVALAWSRLPGAANVFTGGQKPMAAEPPPVVSAADLPGLLERGDRSGRDAWEPRRGNVTRLMPDGGDWEFVASGPAPDPLPPLDLALTVEDGVQQEGQVLRLSKPGVGVVGLPNGTLLARDLAEVIVKLRIHEGAALEIDFIQSPDAVSVLESVVVPLSPGEEWQTLRVTEPLGTYRGAASVPFEGLRLAMPQSHESPVALEVEQITVSERLAVFRRASHGRDVFEIEVTRLTADWQSAPGEYVLPFVDDRGRLLKGAVAADGPLRSSVDWYVAAVDRSGARTVLRTGSAPVGNAWVGFSCVIPEEIEPRSIVLGSSALAEDTVLLWSDARLVDDSLPPRRVVLTLMDTLRADALSCYGGERSSTPSLDALAASGVRFAGAISQCYWTRPSMVSLMTGRYGPATGVHTGIDRLPGSYGTLAEVFSAGGFLTAAFLTNSNAGPDAGLGQGWDHLVMRGVSDLNPDTETFVGRDVVPFVAQHLEEDLLLYVHLMDAHGPYGPPGAPPAGWLPPPGAPVERDSSLDQPWLADPTDAARVQLYHYDVETMDAQWGTFLAQLLSRWEDGDGPATIVALAADHGEYLGEYGLWSHIKHDLVPEIVHVPMILRAPGQLPVGSVVSAPVENIDLAPTLLALAGLPEGALGEAEGESLLPLVAGHGTRDAKAFTSAYAAATFFAEYTQETALLGLRGELVGTLQQPWDPAVSLDGKGDPRAPETVPQRAVDRFLADWAHFVETGREAKTRLWADIDTNSTQLDAASLAHLRELGYLR